MLRLSRSYLYELIGRGELRIIKVGKATLIPRAEIERFVNDRLEGNVALQQDGDAR